MSAAYEVCLYAWQLLYQGAKFILHKIIVKRFPIFFIILLLETKVQKKMSSFKGKETFHRK